MLFKPGILGHMQTTKSATKAEIRLSEIRARFGEIAAEGEASEATTDEVRSLTAESGHLEAIIRAEALSRPDPVVTPTPEPETGSLEELRSACSIAPFLRAASSGIDITGGPEAEYRSEVMGGQPAGQFGPVMPIHMLAAPDELRTNTVAASGVSGDTTLRDWLPRVFASKVTQMLGVSPVMVPTGQQASVLTSSGASPTYAAEGAAGTKATVAHTATTLTPKRLTTNAEVTVEALAQVSSSLEESIRRDLSLALMDKVEEAIITGVAATEGFNGFNATIPSASNPSANTNYRTAASQAAELVDGIYASHTGEICMVVNPDMYSQAFQLDSTDGVKTAATEIMASAMDFRTSAHMLETNTSDVSGASIANGIARLGSRPGDTFMPVWAGMELVRDQYSKATSGLIVITLHMLLNFSITRTAAYKKFAWRWTT